MDTKFDELSTITETIDRKAEAAKNTSQMKSE